MSKVSNWPFSHDLSHPNETLRTPRVSKYDGVGAWAKDSSRIPPVAWLGAIAVVGLFFAVAYIGAAVGF